MDSFPILVIFCAICAVVRPTVGQTESSSTQANETNSVTNVTTAMPSTIPTTVTTEMNETTTIYSTVVTTQELFNCNITECLNGGTCQSNGTCLCLDFYDGDQCEVMIDCPPGSCSLERSTHCTVNMSKPVCHCAPKYIGARCDHENLCLKDPCKNNGTCEIKEQGGYICSCVTGDPQRDCALNDFDACTLNPPASSEKFISCIDHIVGKDMLCAPSSKGVGCLESRDPDEYCLNNSCSDNTGFCQPLCNRPECNGTAACNFTVFSSEDYRNVTKDCVKLFADGYKDHTCYNEADLFDGFDGIKSSLKDCSPFFDTICTRNASDGICNPYCNTPECLWDGLDCINRTLETFDGSILIELKGPVSARQYSALGLALRSGVYYHEFYTNSLNPQLQLKVVKPSEFQNDDNSTIGKFTSIQHIGLFLASFTAKLPLTLTGITDIFVCEAGRHGDKCAENCSEYCTKEGDICDFKTGVCLHGCRTGWWGELCLEACPRGCFGQCNRDNGNCKTCVDGRYGAQNCSNYCDSNCRGVKCDVITGQCDCGRGRYFSLDRSNCSECSVGCEGNCSANGSCTCKPGYFGTRCDKSCSAECKTNTCNAASGRCYGCKAGFYGDVCEKKCGAGCTECQQDSSACGGKCREGYVGDNCQKAGQGEKAVTDNTGVIVAVIVAVLIIIVIIIIAVCYWRYRQAGDYVLKDEEDVDHAPVSKVTSQEVKAHYGLQPLHASPLDGHSSEMIDMDVKPIGGVYAGPAVTVAYSKEDEAVAFDEKNKTSDKEVSEEQGLDQAGQDMTEDNHIANSVTISVKSDVDVNHAAMAVDGDVADADQNADLESREGGAIRAPLASEEDLTASQVLNTEKVNQPPGASIDSLENEALDALDHVGDETNSKRSSKTSEHSKHSRSSSSSSSSSKSSNERNKGDEPQKTEM